MYSTVPTGEMALSWRMLIVSPKSPSLTCLCHWEGVVYVDGLRIAGEHADNPSASRLSPCIIDEYVLQLDVAWEGGDMAREVEGR